MYFDEYAELSDDGKEIGLGGIMEFLITGMTCEGCAKNVQKVIEKVPGVVKVDINLAQKHAKVSTNTSVDLLAVVQAVKNAGYGAEPA